jgi:photosystem II stability/assembly factor-like uncharacterized protein
MYRLVGIIVVLLLAAGCATDEPMWTAHALGTDAVFHDILFLDDQNGWIVGGRHGIEGGVVGHTTDGGQTWRFRSGLVRVPSGISLFHLYAIQFADSSNACMAASGGVILRSGDGGDTWRAVRRGKIYSRLFDIDFIDDTHGWAVGWGFVLATEDGGHTWSECSEKRVDGQAVEFLSANDGWIAGGHGALHRTRDGGETWERIDNLPLTDKPHLLDMQFVDTEYGWIVGDEGAILCTRDGGETWVIQQSPVDTRLTAVSFINREEGWAAGFARPGGGSHVIHTSDGGATWVVQTEVRGEAIYAMQMMEGKGWAVGERIYDRPQKILCFSDPRPETMNADLSQ